MGTEETSGYLTRKRRYISKLVPPTEQSFETGQQTSGTVMTRAVTIKAEETFLPFHTHPEITELRDKVDKLTKGLTDIKTVIEAAPIRVRIVEVKDVSIEDAKIRIFEYLKEHGVAYPDDIADELGFDLKVVIEAMEKLKKEGKIKEAG